MPCGRFVDGDFEITVTLDYDASNEELFTEWTRALQKAAELFFHATDGQLRIGRWLIANRSYGLSAAEVVLHDAGEGSYASVGGFGQPALLGFLRQAHIMPDAKLNPMVIVHELAHQIFGVRDEYTGEVEQDDIVSSASPSTTVIPIDNLERANNALVGVYAGMQQGSLLERRLVSSSTATEVVVQTPFSFLPSAAVPQVVFYQDPDETCHEGPGTNPDGYLCLMQESGNAGTFDAAGVWEAYAGTAPSTDFCSAGNHDPDGDTDHHVTYGKSCWEVLADTMALRFNHPLNVPDPPALAPAADWSPALAAELTYLVEERRLALVIDRSGSMSESSKMSNARAAAQYWVDRLRADTALGGLDAKLALISYNQAPQQHLGLTDGANLPDDIDGTIAGLQPSGWTNIRDALDMARGLLAPNANDRAATQAVVLLTDGVHNFPDDSTALDDVGALQEAGVQVFSVGFGENDDAIDMPTLEALGEATCGSFPFQATSPAAAEILTQQIYDLLLGGLVASEPGTMGGAPPHPGDQALPEDAKERPPLTKVLDGLGLCLDDLWRRRRPRKGGARPARHRVALIEAYVEQGAERASFTLRFPPKLRLWLYLIDPDGQPHPMTAAGTRVVSRDSNEFAVVKAPQPGLWQMVAVRPEPGPAFAFHAFAGVAHRRLVVDGGASAANPPGAPVMIRAAALWGDRLSGLRVNAHVTAPDGARTTVMLGDASVDEPDSGDYRGVFVPPYAGRYQGLIRIVGNARTGPGQRLHRLNHVRIGTGKKVERIEVKNEASRFVRLIPFSFWSGERPKVRDNDRRHR